VFLLGYFAYRLIAGKGNKDELAEVEKTLVAKPQMKPAAEAAAPQIDVADDEQIIPTLDDPAAMDMPDDLMSENLFPLDNMEEPKDQN
jgi:hypothetical protein